MSINTLLTSSSVVMRTFLPLAPGLYRKPLSSNLPEVDSSLRSSDWVGVPTLTSLTLKLDKERKLELKECVCIVTMEKNIVQTALQGRNGTIKEYINDGDYQVEIAAALTAEYDQYPKEEIQKLISFLKVNDSLLVDENSFLGLFGITNLIVKSYGFNQETHSNRQTFTICCLSDTAYEIKLKEDQVC
ncbi:MAG: hypothetical protein E6Q66_07405 [Pedobacter sp.]|jgi:hypothetical protein|nr:MAG: hypothetical protein E6Q66_07405 [Pedobacter sp.]